MATTDIAFEVIKIDVTPVDTAEVHQFDTCCSTNKGMNVPEFARHGFFTCTSRTFDNLKKRGRCNSASCKRPPKLTDDKIRESFAKCERQSELSRKKCLILILIAIAQSEKLGIHILYTRQCLHNERAT